MARKQSGGCFGSLIATAIGGVVMFIAIASGSSAEWFIVSTIAFLLLVVYFQHRRR